MPDFEVLAEYGKVRMGAHLEFLGVTVKFGFEDGMREAEKSMVLVRIGKLMSEVAGSEDSGEMFTPRCKKQ